MCRSTLKLISKLMPMACYVKLKIQRQDRRGISHLKLTGPSVKGAAGITALKARLTSSMKMAHDTYAHHEKAPSQTFLLAWGSYCASVVSSSVSTMPTADALLPGQNCSCHQLRTITERLSSR